jgi:hypothetical protein
LLLSEYGFSPDGGGKFKLSWLSRMSSDVNFTIDIDKEFRGSRTVFGRQTCCAGTVVVKIYTCLQKFLNLTISACFVVHLLRRLAGLGGQGLQICFLAIEV